MNILIRIEIAIEIGIGISPGSEILLNRVTSTAQTTKEQPINNFPISGWVFWLPFVLVLSEAVLVLDECPASDSSTSTALLAG